MEATRSVWENVAEAMLDLPKEMPPVPCRGDQIEQVVRHLLVNAAHAIEDRPTKEPGRIAIRPSHDLERALIEIRDNGCGIPAAHLDRIYDILFTTKAPGRGARQGLALSRMIVARGHGGAIAVESCVGSESCFSVSPPLDGERIEKAPVALETS